MNSTLLAGADCAHAPLNAPNLTTVADTHAQPILGFAAPSVSMNLLARATGNASEAAMSALAARIATIPENRKRPQKAYIQALGATVADLLTAGSFDPQRDCYRPLEAGAFTGQSIGYHPFMRVLNDLARLGFVTVDKGKAAFRGEPGRVTRIAATIRFYDALAAYGLRPSNRMDHFEYGHSYLSSPPIKLKGGSSRGPTWEKVAGKSMKVDWNNPLVERHAAQVRDINAFMAEQDFSFGSEVTFFRGFNLGDSPDYMWNKGGRLYCTGGGYQQVPSRSRKLFLINGEPTVELDISACHLMIAYGLLGSPMPNRADLYDHPDVPRSVVKLFVTSFLGAGKAPSRWNQDHGERFDSRDIKRLSREYPIRSVAGQILDHVPVLNAVQGAGLTWADFQFYESEIIVETVHTLAIDHKVCALPVHDSLIVRKSNEALASMILSDTFKKKVNLYPVIG